MFELLKRWLKNRLVLGLTMGAIFLAMIYIGLPLLAPLFIIVSILALKEFSVMMNLRGIPIRKRSLWVATVLTLPASLPVSYDGIFQMQPLVDGVSWREALLGMFALYLIGLEVIKPNQNSMNTVIFTLFGYIYIPWMLCYGMTLRYTPDGVLGFWYLLLPMFVITMNDAGAYYVGSRFGRRKLAPQLSPNKTLEGALGGVATAVVLVSLLLWGLETYFEINIDLYDAILFGVLGSSAAQLGDLFESLIKRWAGVKDAGGSLAGHGGVLDRIDSMLFAVPVTYYFVTFVIMR